MSRNGEDRVIQLEMYSGKSLYSFLLLGRSKLFPKAMV